MVLFAGLGDNPQKTAGVGIGTLAGSSIMLLTINWAVVLLGGRVDLDENGNPDYKSDERLTRHWSLTSTGTANGSKIREGGFHLVYSIIPFTLIQCFSFGNVWSEDWPTHEFIFWPAMVSLAATLILFVL